MKCKKVIEKVYNGRGREKHYNHIKTCATCRNSIKSINSITSKIKLIDLPKLDEGFTIDVMRKIEKINEFNIKSFPFYRWVFGALSIIFSILFFRIEGIFRKNMPAEISGLIYLTFGIILTMFILIFAASFYDKFKIKYERLREKYDKKYFSHQN